MKPTSKHPNILTAKNFSTNSTSWSRCWGLCFVRKMPSLQSLLLEALFVGISFESLQAAVEVCHQGLVSDSGWDRTPHWNYWKTSNSPSFHHVHLMTINWTSHDSHSECLKIWYPIPFRHWFWVLLTLANHASVALRHIIRVPVRWAEFSTWKMLMDRTASRDIGIELRQPWGYPTDMWVSATNGIKPLTAALGASQHEQPFPWPYDVCAWCLFQQHPLRPGWETPQPLWVRNLHDLCFQVCDDSDLLQC